MKSHILTAIGVAIPIALLCSSCTDDDYNLSDLDTTSRINVENLTVPINIDEITLSDIIDLKEDGKVKVVDGQYVIIEKDKEFDSDPIKVNAVTLSTPELDSSSRNIALDGAAEALAAGHSLELPLDSDLSEYNLTASNVSSSIVSITEVGCELKIYISLSINGFEPYLKGFTIKDVVLGIPKGLADVQGSGRYDSDKGEFYVTNQHVDGNKCVVEISANRLDFGKCGAQYNTTDHTILFNDHLRVISGKAVVAPSDFRTSSFAWMPDHCTYITDFDLTKVEINTFSGQIQYDLNNIDVPAVDLSDLPDIFAQEETDIRLVNPCIYLQIDNPMSGYALHATTGISIISNHKNGSESTVSLQSPFTVSSAAQSNYCLSPAQPASYLEAYSPATHVPFADLGMIFAGAGVPRSIKFVLDDPMLPCQTVTDFRLGYENPGVHGKYTFYSPLQFAAGTNIVYTETIDGWSSEDLDKLTIQTLHVTANVTTDVPISLKFIAYPVDKDGNQINDVEIKGGYIEANASGQLLDIEITGSITNLDGICYTAVAAPKSGEDASALTPNMHIRLTNIRPTVSGYYQTEL